MEVSARRDGTLWAYRRPPFFMVEHGSRRALVGHCLFADHRWLGFSPSRGPLTGKWGGGLTRTSGVGQPASPVTRSWDETERSSLQRRLVARDNHEVIASAASLPNSRKLSRSYLQGPLQATSVMTSNRT